MERRGSNRSAGKYKTEILYGNNSYTGLIENISWSGVSVLTDPLSPEIEFTPDEFSDLRFISPEGQTVTLKCRIIWSSKIPPDNVRSRIGMELMERPWDEIAFFF